MHGFFISKPDGTHLVKYLHNPELQSELLSSFIAGIFLFGKESVGNIDEIIIKGLDIEVLVVYKHDLILTALFSTEMHQSNIKEEAEHALDQFYQKYQGIIQNWCGDVNDFCEFEEIMRIQIKDYFEKIESEQAGLNEKKKGFWKRLFSF